ncbi:MAG: hypothetical protein WBV71_19335 [Roseobacter sp.]
MMNNNKILTVSYGTFSCTLEGFDDSFDTMKAIAEYFRDLASDDRYFGAEPPQPDAEMLARIAEKEVSRRVEAHEHEGRIMLKAHEEQTSEAPAPMTEPASLPKTTAPTSTPNMVESPAMQDPTPRVETPVEAAVSTSSDEIENVSQNIEAEEDATAHAAMTETDMPVEEPAVEDVVPDASDDVAAFFAESVHTEIQTDDMEESISAVDFTVSTSLSDAADETPEPEHSFADAVSDAEEDAQTASFADKLERIRAVVSRQEDEELSTSYEDDDETPEPMGHFADLDAAFTREDDDTPVARDVMADAAQDIVDAFEQDEAAYEPLETADEETAETAEDDADDLDEILRRIEENSDDDDAKDNLFGDGSDDDAETQGRVLKVNRSDLDAALDAGDLEEYEDEDMSASLGAQDSETRARSEGIDEQAPRQALPEIDEETGEDVSRLMAEADQQMQEPEGQTRRSAFAHLRAAVAARFADRSMDDEAQNEEKEAEVYRSDLADVVKPRRAMAGEHRTERPHEERAAPLKLVAEQRIDAEAPPARGPVAPRRVAASAEDGEIVVEDTGFAAYASERGAKSLPELLEAAAAYLAYVEGHEQFSRPELMSRVRQANCGDFTREDGLRSFGQLLRTGKIEKIKGGRFTASDAIGYKPGHRAVG